MEGTNLQSVAWGSSTAPRGRKDSGECMLQERQLCPSGMELRLLVIQKRVKIQAIQTKLCCRVTLRNKQTWNNNDPAINLEIRIILLK